VKKGKKRRKKWPVGRTKDLSVRGGEVGIYSGANVQEVKGQEGVKFLTGTRDRSR